MIPVNYHVVLTSLEVDLSISSKQLSQVFEEMLTKCFIPSYCIVLETNAQSFEIDLFTVQIRSHDLENELKLAFGNRGIAYDYEVIEYPDRMIKDIAQAQQKGYQIIDIKRKYPMAPRYFQYK